MKFDYQLFLLKLDDTRMPVGFVKILRVNTHAAFDPNRGTTSLGSMFRNRLRRGHK